MKDIKTILLVGVFSKPWSTNVHQKLAFERKGIEVIEYDTRDRAEQISSAQMEQELFILILKIKPDLVFISKGRELSTAITQKMSLYCPTWLWYMDNSLGLSDEIIQHIRNSTYASCGGLGIAKLASIKAGKDVFYIPEGCDTSLYRPLAATDTYKCDVAIIGNEALPRTNITELIRAKGFTVKRYGRKEDGGFISGDSYCMAVNGAKIVVDVPRILEDTQSERYYSDRVYQVLACGGFLLINYRKDIDAVFAENYHLSIWRTESELVEKLAYYQGNDIARSLIAHNGMAFVRSRYTWDNSMSQVLEYL